MTDFQKERIVYLRSTGVGYRSIAVELDLPVNSVKSWCKRHVRSAEQTGRCPQCGTAFQASARGKKRVFCSDKCRTAWWTAHPEMRKPKKTYTHKCKYCGREFSNCRIRADYCGRECFARARKKADSNE